MQEPLSSDATKLSTARSRVLVYLGVEHPEARQKLPRSLVALHAIVSICCAVVGAGLASAIFGGGHAPTFLGLGVGYFLGLLLSERLVRRFGSAHDSRHDA